MTEKFINSRAAAGLSDTVLDADYVAGVDTEFVVTILPPDVALQGPDFRVKVGGVYYLITDLGIDDLHWTCSAVENTTDVNHLTGTPVYLEFTRGAIKSRLEDRTYVTTSNESGILPNSSVLPTIPLLSDVDPLPVDTVADPGVGLAASREDHVHVGSTSGGGGGTGAHSYLGYNTIGGTWETATAGNNYKRYFKKITVPSDGFLASIGIHVRQHNTNSTVEVQAALLTDSSNRPTDIIAIHTGSNDPVGFLIGVTDEAQWLHIPIARWITAGDYWIGVQFYASAADFQIAYDTGGSDRVHTPSGLYMFGHAGEATTDSTFKYSIRADFIEPAPTPGLILLEQHTASASAQLDFNSWLNDTLYNDYIIRFSGIVPATNGASLVMRMATGGGPTVDAGANYSYGSNVWRPGGIAQTGSAGQTEIVLDYNASGDGISTTANFTYNGEINLWHPSSGQYTMIDGKVVYIDTAGPFRVAADLMGAYETTTPVTGLRFLMSTGNIASGNISIYGVSK